MSSANIKKLMESLDSIGTPDRATPGKIKAFKDLGLDMHHWEVFSMVYDYQQRRITQLEWQIEQLSYNDR